MPNSGAFKKGQKKRRQGERGPGKATIAAKEAITRLVDGNVGRVQQWLDEVYKQDGAKAALNCFSDLLEYAVPKLARTEIDATLDHQLTVVEIKNF